MPYFQTLGIPCAVGMLVAVVVALTLGPAVLAVGSRFGLFDPKRTLSVRGWRRVGTAVVRWPVPIFAVTCAVTLVGLLTLPGYKPNYHDRDYLPELHPGQPGIDGRRSPFPPAPDDARDSDDRGRSRHAQSVGFPGVGQAGQGRLSGPGYFRVQAITRPDGTADGPHVHPVPDEHAEGGQMQTMKYQSDRMDDMVKQADEMTKTIGIMQRMYRPDAPARRRHPDMVGDTHDMQADHQRPTG